MISSEAGKTHTFRNCRLRILRGDDEEDGGHCALEVCEEPTCFVVVRNGRITQL